MIIMKVFAKNLTKFVANIKQLVKVANERINVKIKFTLTDTRLLLSFL